MAPLHYLQSWYLAQCNGEWEHVRGVIIETLDNPGWLVTIDLIQTALEDRAMIPIREERSQNDWLSCSVESNQFRGYGDAGKLEAICGVFQNWAVEHAKVE